MNEKLKGGIFVFLGGCSFGVPSIIARLAMDEGYGVGDIASCQAILGAVFFWIGYLIYTKNRKNKSILSISKRKDSKPKTSPWKVMLAGTCTGLVGVFNYQALLYLPASICVILLMQYLWISILLDFIIFRKRPTRNQIFAASIVLLGTALAGGIFAESFHLDIKGVVLGMMAALCYSLFILISGRVGNEYPSVQKGAYLMTGSAILSCIIFRPMCFFNGDFLDGLYIWGIAIAIFGGVISPGFFSYGMPRIGIAIGAILSAAELPMGVFLSYFILKEYVSFVQWVGVVIILLGIVVGNMKSRKIGSI